MILLDSSGWLQYFFDEPLAMADAIIYATARIKGAPLVTSDPHFEGLQGVIFIEDRCDNSNDESLYRQRRYSITNV